MDSNTTNERNVKPNPQEIDLLKLVRKIWNSRNLILKVCGIGTLIGLIINFENLTGQKVCPGIFTSSIITVRLVAGLAWRVWMSLCSFSMMSGDLGHFFKNTYSGFNQIFFQVDRNKK